LLAGLVLGVFGEGSILASSFVFFFPFFFSEHLSSLYETTRSSPASFEKKKEWKLFIGDFW
jgi:hypothetical protein